MENVNKVMIRKRRPWDLGTWVWLLNRIAGVIILGYLITHIFVIGAVRSGSESFNGLMGKLHNPVMLFLEFLLIMAVLAHGLNGVRHLLIDFHLVVSERHKVLFWLAAGICALFFVVAGMAFILSGDS